ncbi:MAG: AI-2E family transporter [Epsilonproteobacteria bacterium]|nr:MAG: AI-2E family transporter [Campylobacterota bacterium]
MNNKQKISSNNTIDNAIRIGLIALLTASCLYIAAPFIGPILWGIIIAVGTYPLYQLMQKKLGLSNGWTATIFTTLMLIFLITPTIMLSNALVSEASIITQDLKNDSLVISPPPESVVNLPFIGKDLSIFWTKVSEDPKATLGEMEPQIKKLGKWLVKSAGGAALGILMLIFSIIIAGIFLASAEAGRNAAETIFSRFIGGRGKEMTDLSRDTVTSVVNGILGIAVIQTLLAGMGFMAMDIPGAGILALICLVLAIVQIDILIILIPLSIYMFNVTDTGPAIAFLVWNIMVGLMNNVLKPILLARGVEAPMSIIFIGAIGGLIAHGIIGLFIGGVVFVLGYKLFVFWLHEEKETSTSM